MGRIHLGRQDLSKLQTRKMKGLKRGRDEGEDLNGNENELISPSDQEPDDEEGGVELKKLKVV